GDEFTVIIPEFEHYGDIEQVAQKLIDAILKPHRIKEHEVQVSASIGIALCPEDAEDRDTLINKADTAMYAAKRDGKNRYRFYFDNAFDEEASIDQLTRE
ncbi:MAG TPA: GGDEF domain-containing protein, partial [Gammaproteobacteria bacterium]